MRKIPFIWLILALVFSPPGSAFFATQTNQQDQHPPCHEQADGKHRQHDRQAGEAHDCCEPGSEGMASQCCEHCPAPAAGLLTDISHVLPETAKTLISDPLLSYPPQLTSLPYKPPRA